MVVHPVSQDHVSYRIINWFQFDILRNLAGRHCSPGLPGQPGLQGPPAERGMFIIHFQRMYR